MQAKTFVRRRRLAWGEADPSGTLYAPQALDFAIQTIEALWIEALGRPFRDLHQRHGKGWPWVHVSLDFASPLLAGQEFDVQVTLEKIGATSLAYRVEGAAPDGTALFRLKMVAATIDHSTLKSAPLPDDIRTALAPYVVEEPPAP
ncbi:MAG: acyl-CoA thioesterase [Pseudomonadota bacterium]